MIRKKDFSKLSSEFFWLGFVFGEGGVFSGFRLFMIMGDVWLIYCYFGSFIGYLVVEKFV